MKKLKKTKTHTPHHLNSVFDQAHKLLIAYETEEALDLLVPLQKKYANNYEFNLLLFEALKQANLSSQKLLVAITLWHLGKRANEQDWVNLIESYHELKFWVKPLFLAYEAAAKFPQNNFFKTEINKLKKIYDEAWHGLALKHYRQQYPNVTQESALPHLVIYDQVAEQIFFNAYPEALSAAEEYHHQAPNDVHMLGLLGQLHSLLGQFVTAEQYAQKAIDIIPDYLPTLNVVAYIHYLRGKSAADNLAYQQIKKIIANDELLNFSSELIVVYGEYELLIQAYTALDKKHNPLISSTVQNYIATAYALSGDWPKAEKIWGELREVMPNLDEDLKQSKQNLQQRPFCYTISEFPQLQEISLNLEKLRKDKAIEKIKNDPFSLRSFEQALKFGDEECRQIILYILKQTRLPEFEAILWEFGTGPLGASPERLEALHILQTINPQRIQKGTRTPFWFKRQQKEIYWLYNHMDFVSDTSHFSASDNELMQRAYQAALADNEDKAILLYEKLKNKYPNDPVPQNNLLFCYLKKHPEKKEELINQFLEKFPGYFFGYIQKAEMWLDENNLDQAELYLEELKEQFSSYHVAEYMALCGVCCKLALEKGNKEEAWYWYDLIEAFDKEHPLLHVFEPQLIGYSASSFLKKLWNKYAN